MKDAPQFHNVDEASGDYLGVNLATLEAGNSLSMQAFSLGYLERYKTDALERIQKYDRQ